MNWTEISITANHQAVPIISNILEEFGSNGVVIEDSQDLQNGLTDKLGEIYELNPEDYKHKISRKIKSIEVLDAKLFEYEQQTIQEHDWENEWKNYFHPFRASEKFTIVPSWETYQKEDANEMCIELDPGMAFGTGDHPTTSMCLKAIEKFVKSEDSVIDVGTGSGILSIASHLLGVKRIKALDVDEMAIKVAKENFEKNHCEAA